MFALRPGHRAKRSCVAGGDAPEGFVLPKWLRRPVRMFLRFCAGDLQPPRFTAAVLNTLLIGSFTLYGVYAGGHTEEVVKNITARTGFAVDQVKVIGNRETSEIDVLEQLQLDGWTSLIGMNALEARDRIAALPWIEQVSVRKTYPNAIEVRLEERQPFAIWQHNGQLAIIEASGKPITPFQAGRLAKLPRVVGEGAELDAAKLVDKMAAYPDLAARARVYQRIAQRRWDIQFDSGVTVQLPEFGEDAALADLERMDRETGLLGKDIELVDLRLADRVVVRLTAEANERREAELKAKPKAKAGKRI